MHAFVDTMVMKLPPFQLPEGFPDDPTDKDIDALIDDMFARRSERIAQQAQGEKETDRLFFVSYCHADVRGREELNGLLLQLSSKVLGGFLDVFDIPQDSPQWREIASAHIKPDGIVVVLWSKAAAQSEPCRWELELALSVQAHIVFVPLDETPVHSRYLQYPCLLQKRPVHLAEAAQDIRAVCLVLHSLFEGNMQRRRGAESIDDLAITGHEFWSGIAVVMSGRWTLLPPALHEYLSTMAEMPGSRPAATLPSLPAAAGQVFEGGSMSPTALRRPLLGVALATLLLLLIPAVAMRFTAEVSWGPGDFVVAAVVLFGAGSVMVLGLRHVQGTAGRAALVLGVAFALALVWAELAVGLFS